MKSKTVDFLIVGAGVIGLNLALRLKKIYSDSSVCVIEKEPEPGLHASGRNSGVLHAGFYYSSDSVKARFCKDGNEYLTDYCQTRRLPINRCGKLVVASNASELEGLSELLRRGQKNGVALDEISEAEAKEIEPRVSTYQKALFSPATATVSPRSVVNALLTDIKDAGVELWTDTAFIKHAGSVVMTSRGNVDASYVVNAAGLYADRIAQDYGFSKDYRILPFKGLYLYAGRDGAALKTNIYPVPNLEHPFLGVHFTVGVDGKTKIGPTAIPALWREQYGGLENFDFVEMMEITMREMALFCHNQFGFRQVAYEELRKQSRSRMVALAGKMVKNIENDRYEQWGKPGIRAQLVNIRKKTLEMDFIFEGDSHSFHVLNAVSPAFTCASPFSAYLVGKIGELIR